MSEANDEYKCVMIPPPEVHLKSETVEVPVKVTRVEGFTIKDGKKVPNGISFEIMELVGPGEAEPEA